MKGTTEQLGISQCNSLPSLVEWSDISAALILHHKKIILSACKIYDYWFEICSRVTSRPSCSLAAVDLQKRGGCSSYRSLR